MKKHRPQRASTDVTLNITALADTMVVLLVFLLKSSATGLIDIVPTETLVLPEGIGKSDLEDSVKLEIGERSIKFEQNDIMPLINFRMRPTEFRPDGASSTLVKFFNENKKTIEGSGRTPAGSKAPSRNKRRILVLADSRVPYGTIRRVFASASNEGLSKFKLVIVRTE